MAVEVGGHVLVSVGNLLHVIYNVYVFEQLPAQHDANFFQYGVLFMDTLLFSVHFYDACI